MFPARKKSSWDSSWLGADQNKSGRLGGRPAQGRCVLDGANEYKVVLNGAVATKFILVAGPECWLIQGFISFGWVQLHFKIVGE